MEIQPYGSVLYTDSFSETRLFAFGKPALVMTDPQESRGQIDVTGKAKANFRGKIRKNFAYAIRFLGGWHAAQREESWQWSGAVSAVAAAGCYAWRLFALFAVRR